jgi:hypothetical protein
MVKILLTVLDADGRKVVLVKKDDREMGAGSLIQITTAAGDKINAVVMATNKDPAEHQVQAMHLAHEKLEYTVDLLKSDGWTEAAE